MNKIVLAFLLLVTSFSFAQQFPVQEKKITQFDKFITKPGIEWAAYITDTVRFAQNNLSRILRDRFEKEEIKVSRPVTSRTAGSDNIIYSKKEDVLAALPPDVYFDSLANDLLEVVQILFVKKAKLVAYTAWVSPKYSVITPGGLRLGYANYFSSSFNLKYGLSRSSRNKHLALGQTKRKIPVDSLPSIDMLKSLYGKNVIESLWPYILKDKMEIYSAETDKRLSADELNASLIFDAISIPVYDSSGTLSAHTKLLNQPMSPDMFTTIELTQNWFYDQKKNIVYNTIPEIVLYAKNYLNGSEGETARPILKIVFK